MLNTDHNYEFRKKRAVKPYSLDKKYKVYIDGTCFMSYSDLNLAIYCKSVIPNSYLIK